MKDKQVFWGRFPLTHRPFSRVPLYTLHEKIELHTKARSRIESSYFRKRCLKS